MQTECKPLRLLGLMIGKASARTDTRRGESPATSIHIWAAYLDYYTIYISIYISLSLSIYIYIHTNVLYISLYIYIYIYIHI